MPSWMTFFPHTELIEMHSGIGFSNTCKATIWPNKASDNLSNLIWLPTFWDGLCIRSVPMYHFTSLMWYTTKCSIRKKLSENVKLRFHWIGIDWITKSWVLHNRIEPDLNVSSISRTHGFRAVQSLIMLYLPGRF